MQVNSLPTKILITGGAGFIGSSLADSLLKDNNRVCVVDNYLTGMKENNQTHTNLTVYHISISDAHLVNEIFNEFQPEIVVHAAASYKNPDAWDEDIDNNIIGTVNVIKACKLFGVQKLVYYQTSLCYGISQVNEPINIGHPYFSGTYEGGSSYAISKTTAELYLELSGINFISLRLANVYGPRNLSGPLPSFFHRLYNNLPCVVVDTKRDFIYIDDVVDCTCKAIRSSVKKGYYHISTGTDHTIKELFERTLEILGKNKTEIVVDYVEKGPDDVNTILLDPSQTMLDFDWKPMTSFSEGVRKAISWYQENGISQTYTHLKNIPA